MSISLLVIIALVVMFLASAIKILNEYERGVIFRLGRLISTKGPGLIILIPLIDKMQKVRSYCQELCLSIRRHPSQDHQQTPFPL